MSLLRTVIIVFAVIAAVLGRDWSAESSLRNSVEKKIKESELEENYEANLGSTEDYSGAQVWKVSTEAERSRAVIMEMNQQNSKISNPT